MKKFITSGRADKVERIGGAFWMVVLFLLVLTAFWPNTTMHRVAVTTFRGLPIYMMFACMYYDRKSSTLERMLKRTNEELEEYKHELTELETNAGRMEIVDKELTKRLREVGTVKK